MGLLQTDDVVQLEEEGDVVDHTLMSRDKRGGGGMGGKGGYVV